MESEYSPSSEMSPSPRCFMNIAASSAIRSLSSAVRRGYVSSYSPNSLPVTAFLAVLEGSGRSLHGSSASILTVAIAFLRKSSNSLSTNLLVEKLPNFPSTKRQTLIDLSRQWLTLSSSPLSVPNSSIRLLLSVTRTLSAPRARAFCRHMSAVRISCSVSIPLISSILLSSHCQFVYQHRRDSA